MVFSAAQNLGDLNVVIVGWGDSTAAVNSLTDSAGNLYRLASGPTVQTGSSPLSQSIYYAPNIVAGANAVTLTFNTPAIFPDAPPGAAKRKRPTSRAGARSTRSAS